MIVLHQPPPPPGWGLPNMSPFCVKLETYLRMAKLEYRTAPWSPVRAPKGKMPYVQIDGRLMGDSHLVIDYLKRTRGDPLDANLSAEQRAVGLAVQRMVEEHLYFCGAWMRWENEESFAHVRRFMLTILPPVIGPLLLRKIRRDFLRDMKSQGVARHTREEVVGMALDDLASVSAILGAKSFLLGGEPSSYDASLYGLLVQLFRVPWDSEVKSAARESFPNLEKFCDRMNERYWRVG